MFVASELLSEVLLPIWSRINLKILIKIQTRAQTKEHHSFQEEEEEEEDNRFTCGKLEHC